MPEKSSIDYGRAQPLINTFTVGGSQLSKVLNCLCDMDNLQDVDTNVGRMQLDWHAAMLWFVMDNVHGLKNTYQWKNITFWM